MRAPSANTARQPLISRDICPPAVGVAKRSEWTEEDTALCKEAIARGIAIDKATGKPLTFADMQAQYDDYEPVRSGQVDYETFIKGRIEARPFDG